MVACHLTRGDSRCPVMQAWNLDWNGAGTRSMRPVSPLARNPDLRGQRENRREPAARRAEIGRLAPV
jgi:hypothetical protein